MKKSEILKWIEERKEESINKVKKEKALKIKEVENIIKESSEYNSIKTLTITSFSSLISSINNIVESSNLKDYINVKTIKENSEYYRNSSIYNHIKCYTSDNFLLNQSIFQEVIMINIDKIDNEYSEIQNNVERNFIKLKSYIRDNARNGKEALSMLNELGFFPTPKEKGNVALALNIDTRYLNSIIGGKSNE